MSRGKPAAINAVGVRLLGRKGWQAGSHRLFQIATPASSSMLRFLGDVPGERSGLAMKCSSFRRTLSSSGMVT